MNKIEQFLLNKIAAPIVNSLGKIQWESLTTLIKGRPFALTMEDWLRINNALQDGPCIILTRRKSHMSSYLISLGSFLARAKYWHLTKFKAKFPRLGYWSHTCANMPHERDDAGNIITNWPTIVESVGDGTKYSSFNKVFNCDSVCVLRPKGYTMEQRLALINEMIENINKPYDTFGNLKDESAMNCVELVIDGLDESTDRFEKDLLSFSTMVRVVGTATPDMIYDSGSFEILFEKRR